MEMPNLTLYILSNCPYCQKVMRFLTERGITVPLKKLDTDGAIREELIKIGGKKQAPCLVIEGKALYESNDIIQWFIEHYPK